LPVDIADGSLGPGEIRRPHPVVAALVHLEPTTTLAIVIVELVEPVPPVEVVFGQVGLAGLAGVGPGAGHQEVPFDRGHDPMTPAGAAGLAFDRGHVVLAVHIPQVERARRIRQRCERDTDTQTHRNGHERIIEGSHLLTPFRLMACDEPPGLGGEGLDGRMIRHASSR